MSLITIRQPRWSESVLVVVKAGDMFDGPRDGEIICYIDPLESGWSGAPLISDHMAKVFRMETRPRSMKPQLDAAIAQNAVYRDTGSRRRVLLDSTDRIYDNFRDYWISPEVVPIIIAGGLGESGIIDIDTGRLLVETDINAISSGSYTVGSAGDYATGASAASDLTNLTGALTLTYISNISENARALINNRALGGYTFTWDDDTGTGGDPTSGHTITFTQTNQGHYWILTGSGTVNCSGFHTKRNTTGTDALRIDLNDAGATVNVYNLIVDGNGGEARFNDFNGANTAWKVYQCLARGHTSASFYSVSGSVVEYENCSADNTVVGFNSISNADTIRSCVATNCTTCFTGVSNATGLNTAADDTTNENGDFSSGSNNVSSVSAAAIWTSTSIASSDWLTPVSSSAIDGTGASATLWSTAIDGNSDAQTIGAKQLGVSNEAPVASNVAISGSPVVDQTLTGSYDYSDNESDPEGTSTFKWYCAEDAVGTGAAEISGATSQTYDVTGEDYDNACYIAFEVTPVASSGTSPGDAVVSDYVGPVTLPSGGGGGGFGVLF